MQYNTFKCDACKKIIDPQLHFQLFKERRMDASGNHYDNTYYDFDLCNDCAASVLQRVLGKLNKNEDCSILDFKEILRKEKVFI